MSERMNERSKFLKSTAVAVLGSFLFVTVAGPFAEASIWEERQKALGGGKEQKGDGGEQARGAVVRAGLKVDFGVTSSGIEVPEELGTVVESWGGEEGLSGKGTGQPTVVDLEDAHGVYEAQ